MGVGGNQTYIFSFKKGEEWENLKKQNKQTMKEETAPHPPTPTPRSWIQCMSVGIVYTIKMNICQQENEKQPLTFSITRLQSGIESTL